jgi:hypothetical protein
MDTTGTLSNRQLGSLQVAFQYLGYEGRAERSYRLAAAAAALGLAQLDSFKDLTPGQAGYLQGKLRRGEIASFTGWPNEGFCAAPESHWHVEGAPSTELQPATRRQIADAVIAALALCILMARFLTADRTTRAVIAVIACSSLQDKPT